MVKVTLTIILALWTSTIVEANFAIECLAPEKKTIMQIDEKKYHISKSTAQLVSSCDQTIVNNIGRQNYSCQRSLVDQYAFIESDLYKWELCDKNGENVCEFLVFVAENDKNALISALAIRDSWTSGTGIELTQAAKRSGVTLYFCDQIKGQKGYDRSARQEVIDTFIQQGTVITYIKWSDSIPLPNIKTQIEIFSQLIDVIRSGEAHPDTDEFIARAMKKRRAREKAITDQYRLRTDPGYGMEKYICHLHIKNETFSTLPEGKKDFVSPEGMWNRPSLTWFSQFDKTLLPHDLVWNERGDRLTLTIAKTQQRRPFQCGIYVAHTTSEHNALCFMKGFALDRYWRKSYRNIHKEGMYRIVPRLVGEYDLALKPQLDDSGALIPNSDESDICFVRNNTAVRVVADRPDVSVLWIAKKIDEELIAAGKGEPPTWSPPRKRTPASAARQQPVAVPSKQH